MQSKISHLLSPIALSLYLLCEAETGTGTFKMAAQMCTLCSPLLLFISLDLSNHAHEVLSTRHASQLQANREQKIAGSLSSKCQPQPQLQKRNAVSSEQQARSANASSCFSLTTQIWSFTKSAPRLVPRERNTRMP